MRTIKPKPIEKGDVIGIVAPASPPKKIEYLNRGIQYLENLGYRVEIPKNLYRMHGYLAGTDDERVEDLHSLFSNRNVKAIFSVRGGYGSLRLIQKINFRLIRNHPKIFVGYSDITSLQLAFLAKTGLITFSGPMVGVEMSSPLNFKQEEQFWQMLTSSKVPPPIQIDSKYKFREQIKRGVLIGGNLSAITSLAGTNYFPQINPMILLLEEIGERPYRIDRMLTYLKLLGILKHTNAILLGAFTKCHPEKGKPSLKLEQIFQDFVDGYSIPLVGHLAYGHIKNSYTLPIGAKVKVNTRTNCLYFLESPIS